MKSKHVFYLFLLLSGFISVKLLFSIPSILSDIRFDGQNLIVWKYAASTGMLPYKDVFYPYGLLNYYINVNFVATLLNALLFFLLLLGFCVFLSKIITKSPLGLLMSSILLAVILFVCGISSFLRYGIAALGALFLSYVLFKDTLNNKVGFLFGVLSGVFLFLVTDQGVYLVLFFTLFYWMNGLFKKRKKFLSSKSFKLYGIFLLGLIIGVVPFVLYYIHLNILSDFVHHFIRTPDISLYAKAPYFHSLKSLSGIFNSIILFISISYLSYVFFLHKKKITNGYYALLALTIVYLVVEQKGIIRSLGQQISFISLLMGMLLFQEVFQKHIRKFSTVIIYSSATLLCCIFLYTFKYPLPGYIQYKQLDFKKIGSAYIPALTSIRIDKKLNANIFSLPTDPIFYITNNQKPPYFFTVYDGSPRYAQNVSIEYIKNHDVSYVIYNTAIHSVQDGVPDYLRAPYVFSYIFNNFYPYKKVNTYVVLKKGDTDFFDTRLQDNFAELQNYFQNIELGSIPYSEGYYKNNLFKNDQFIRVTKESSMSVPTRDKFLLIYFKKNIREISTITVQTKDNHQTRIAFKSCKVDFPCVINLSNIPLFYKNRSIASIGFNADVISEIHIARHKDKSSFW